MVFNIRKISWTKIMNKRGSRIEPCGVTDSIFYHELQEEFIFLYGFVTGADLFVTGAKILNSRLSKTCRNHIFYIFFSIRTNILIVYCALQINGTVSL